MLKSINLSTNEVYDNTDLYSKEFLHQDLSDYANAFKNNDIK